VREDHDEARLEDHVVAHVRVVAGHHDDRLLVRNAPTNVLKRKMKGPVGNSSLSSFDKDVLLVLPGRKLRVGEEERRKKSSTQDCWPGVYLTA
jgi:hypothetical protein